MRSSACRDEREDGVRRGRDDLLAELADVIITAAVTMSGVTGDVDEARRHLERRLAAVTERAGSDVRKYAGLHRYPGMTDCRPGPWSCPVPG